MKLNHILISGAILVGTSILAFAFGEANGEARVRFEAKEAAEICGQLRDMRFNELSAHSILLGADPDEARFFDCTDMNALAQDTYWDDATKALYFDNFLGRPPRGD